MSAVTNYQKQAIDFLNATSTGLTVTFKHYGTMPNWDDNVSRDVFVCVLKNKQHRYRFIFGQSASESTGNGDNKPTAYDVLACLTKSDPYSFEDFCSNFGYEEDSRKAYKIFKAVMKEWKNVELLFTPEQIEELQEIN